MFFKNLKILFIFFFILTACSRVTDGKMCSFDDFVKDSFLINEGKYSILTMYGNGYKKLDANLLLEKKEIIENEDILSIEIYHPLRKDLMDLYKNISSEKGFQVIDGNIFLPNLDKIKLIDLTLEEASNEILKKFSCLKDVKIFVSFKKRKEKKVEITGVITKQIQISSNTSLFDLFSLVNAPLSFSFFDSYILRNNTFLAVDFYKLLKEGDMSQNIILEDKDKIFLADLHTSKIFVLGEVQRPISIDIPNGKISLKEALCQAGGLSYTADISYIQIFRSNITDPKIYLLSWDNIVKLPSSFLNLIDGDVVYVASKPIASWNRFIMQILPSISIFDSAYRGFKNMGILIDGK